MAQAPDRKPSSAMLCFKELRERRPDLRIRVGGETISGHRSILSKMTKYFKRELDGRLGDGQGQIAEVVLTDLNASAVREIRDYIYTGRLPFTENVYDLLKAYDVLEVCQPIDDPLLQLVEDIDKENKPIRKAFTLLHYAQDTERTLLAEFMSKHILKHVEHFFLEDDDILKISHSHLKEMVEQRYLPPGKEDLLADGVNRWINHSYEERQKYVVPLFSQVGGKLARNLLECYTAPFPKWTPSLFR